ncbi:hypothetical protein [Halorhabdus rudnickae]|uniref:hypothetical protein n=1 Tax=Halorhabdus rudnickae TaxID=1775544 RepID=UPI0010823648|nr:hypothetical protein [Halorhabdus rudnickae]
MATSQRSLGAFEGAKSVTDRDGNQHSIATVETSDDLRAWAQAYARDVVDEHDMDVDLERVTFQVDTTDRSKARIAAMKSLDLPVRTTIGVPIDWGKIREHVPIPEGSDIEEHRNVRVKLTWNAFDAESIGPEDCRGALRHELVHVEQYQQFGTSNHRDGFKARAREIDAPLEGPQWSDPSYLLFCSECGQKVGERHRASKVTKNPNEYGSECCHAPLNVEDVSD